MRLDKTKAQLSAGCRAQHSSSMQRKWLTQRSNCYRNERPQTVHFLHFRNWWAFHIGLYSVNYWLESRFCIFGCKYPLVGSSDERRLRPICCDWTEMNAREPLMTLTGLTAFVPQLRAISRSVCFVFSGRCWLSDSPRKRGKTFIDSAETIFETRPIQLDNRSISAISFL